MDRLHCISVEEPVICETSIELQAIFAQNGPSLCAPAARQPRQGSEAPERGITVWR